MSSYEYGAGIWLFGQFVDRYASDGYGPEISTLEAIERAGQVGRIKWLDINIPCAGAGISNADVAAALDANGIKPASITPHIYTRTFRKGAFTNPDPKVRQQAIDLCKEGAEIALELGATYTKFWPGQDGHDYPLQADHAQLWDLNVEGMRAVTEAYPEMQFAIEYKLKEPRGHMLMATAATTLLAIEDVGTDNLGIVMDMGHSLFAKEAPAAALQLVHRRGKLVSVELNDNRLEWDDDLTVGALHPVETIEFLIAVRKIGWDRPLLLDQFPFREDPVEAALQSIETLEAMQRLIDRLDLGAFAAAQTAQDAMAAQRLVLDLMLDLGPRA